MVAAMKIEVKNWDNQVTGKMELPDAVFGREVNQHLVWEVVRAYLASRRRGTHKTKERSDVAGTRSKPWKQSWRMRLAGGSCWKKSVKAAGRNESPRSWGSKILIARWRA